MPANVIASGIASMERDRNVGGFGFFLGELIGKDGEAVEFCHSEILRNEMSYGEAGCLLPFADDP
jgi:hypothetical protein